MFHVGDRVIDSSNRIFEIESITSKNFGFGEEIYYVLRPCHQYDFNNDYRSYVPSKNADAVLRPLLNKEQAIALIDHFGDLETYDNINTRERKTRFTRIATGGNRREMLKAVKTLICYRDKRIKENKPFSDYDQKLLNSMSNLIFLEFSMVLNVSISKLYEIIYQKSGLSI